MSSRRSRSGGIVTLTTLRRVPEVLAEAPRRDLGRQVAVRRRDDPDVDATVRVSADALELVVLQRAQQLGLERRRELADLVEEDGAAVGNLEPALS
jgi:hypothetical protein